MYETLTSFDLRDIRSWSAIAEIDTGLKRVRCMECDVDLGVRYSYRVRRFLPRTTAVGADGTLVYRIQVNNNVRYVI